MYTNSKDKKSTEKAICLGVILGLIFSFLGLFYYSNINSFHYYNSKGSTHKCKHKHERQYRHKHQKQNNNNDLENYYFYRYIVPIYPK